MDTYKSNMNEFIRFIISFKFEMIDKDPKISLKTQFGWGKMNFFLNKMYYYSPPIRFSSHFIFHLIENNIICHLKEN